MHQLERRLQHRSDALHRPARTSLTESARMLAEEMKRTAENSKCVPDAFLIAEFSRVFERESPEAIQWAFRAWRDESPYFQAVTDIRGLVAEFHRGQRAQAEMRERREEKLRLEEARQKGELLDFAELRKQLAKITERCKMPENEHSRRQHFGLRRDPADSPMIPAVHLTAEEIAARRDTERAEIRRYMERAA